MNPLTEYELMQLIRAQREEVANLKKDKESFEITEKKLLDATLGWRHQCNHLREENNELKEINAMASREVDRLLKKIDDLEYRMRSLDEPEFSKERQ